jgi:DNA end-binding protein Ku
VPRTICSGAVSFGLVTVPIDVAGATVDHPVRFHQGHLKDGGGSATARSANPRSARYPSSEIGKG